MKYPYTILAGLILSQSAIAQIDIYYSDAYSIEEKCAREAEQYEPEKEAIGSTFESDETANEQEDINSSPDYHDAYESCLRSNNGEF